MLHSCSYDVIILALLGYLRTNPAKSYLGVLLQLGLEDSGKTSFLGCATSSSLLHTSFSGLGLVQLLFGTVVPVAIKLSTRLGCSIYSALDE